MKPLLKPLAGVVFLVWISGGLWAAEMEPARLLHWIWTDTPHIILAQRLFAWYVLLPFAVLMGLIGMLIVGALIFGILSWAFGDMIREPKKTTKVSISLRDQYALGQIKTIEELERKAESRIKRGAPV